MKLLTIDQLEEGLQMQEASRRSGLNRSIGACLHDLGYLNLVKTQNVMKALGFPKERRRLIPDLEVTELIGRGASGAVYRGFSDELKEEIAVKVRAPKVRADDPDGARFRIEAAYGRRLNHPNIVRLFSAGETRDFIYHVLEYVDGYALDQLLDRDGTVPESAIIEVGLQVCSALECARKEDIVHRDIKPANIMIAKNGRVKLCDLGLAKDLNSDLALTADGMLLGSPFYIAPEYAQTGDLDNRSDLYALGVTLFHCATGDVPFNGRTALEILQSVVQDPTPSASERNEELSAGLSHVLLRMMAKRPCDRYQVPADAIAAFEALKKGEFVEPPRRAGLLGRFKGLFGNE
ncbi:MAG: serine/threonine-protein kinase [Planctomycetota bacterium]